MRSFFIEDTITSVKISKVDIADGEELEGATIQLIDKETGEVVEEWTSTNKAHEVTGLTTGKTYILRETVAPEGYSITSDTTFELKEDGSIDTEKTTTSEEETTVSEEETTLPSPDDEESTPEVSTPAAKRHNKSCSKESLLIRRTPPRQ